MSRLLPRCRAHVEPWQPARCMRGVTPRSLAQETDADADTDDGASGADDGSDSDAPPEFADYGALPPNLEVDDMDLLFPEDTLPYAEGPLEPLPVLKFTAPGETVGSVALDERVFGVDIRPDLVHRVVRWQLAKNRTKTYRTKTISEVSGSGRKPWPQKGTGRARAGHSRPPHWRGGAKAHGPRVRDWSHKLPRKVRIAGLRVALAAKYRERRLVVVDDLALESARTADLGKLLDDHGWDMTRLLFIDGPETDDNFVTASGNIKRTSVLPSQGANVYDIVRRDTLVVTTAGLDGLVKRLATF